MNVDIINGSEKWIEKVPDKYAIKHIEAYISPIEKDNMILKFEYVKNCCRAVSKGFIKRCGYARVPYCIGEYVEGIIICQNDTSDNPTFYYKKKDECELAGSLIKCEIHNTVYEPHKFSKIIHYSNRHIERQKCDEHAPQWLKDFATKHGANVAYFEF